MAKATKDSLRFNSWTLGLHGADVFEKSAEALELERMNPLRGVDEWRLGQIFDDARDGIYADLAWLYNEIEGVEPALFACCDMRESAASECGWLVKTSDAKRVSGFDQTLADEQRDALLAAFGAVDDDLAELACHLTGAFFRGAAHARPLWNADGSLAGFQALDLWNFALDKKTGLWYWNADASRDERSFQAIPPGELVSLSASRHVDHAALPIFIRAALGAKRYGVWLDRFGIPPVGIIMPPTAEKGDQPAYMELARKFARGGSGILPNASQVVYGTEARSVCPFTDFIRFQQQQIYTVGIGRVQSGETDAANLGGNAAGVIENGFQRIVRRDSRRIARAINDAVTSKILARLFPGRPVLAQFAWDTETKRTSRQVLEEAELAKNAGLAIDLDQIQELTGYKIVQASVNGPDNSGMSVEQLAALIYPLKAAGYTTQKPMLEHATGLRLENAATDAPAKTPLGGLNGRAPDPVPSAPSSPILAAFAADCGPAAEAVKTLLKDPSKEAAEALLKRLPDLLPEDPALAAVIAEAMAAEFRPAPSAPADGEATNAETSEGAKKGWETRRRNGWTPEQFAENKAKVDGLVDELNKKSPDGKHPGWAHLEESLGTLDEGTISDIKAAFPEMQVDSSEMTVDTTQLQHAMNEHGEGRETDPNQIPITHDDLKRVPDVLSDYDEIVSGKGKKDGKHHNAVVFRKKYEDGTICCVEIDQYSEKRKGRILRFETMWKEKVV